MSNKVVRFWEYRIGEYNFTFSDYNGGSLVLDNALLLQRQHGTLGIDEAITEALDLARGICHYHISLILNGEWQKEPRQLHNWSKERFDEIYWIVYLGAKGEQDMVEHGLIPDNTSDFVAEFLNMLQVEKKIRLREEMEREKRDRQEREKRRGYVYVLCADNGLSKIGRTQKPDQRIESIQASLIVKSNLRLMVAVEDMYEVEKRLHTIFSSKRRKREWFLLDDADLDRIDQVLAIEHASLEAKKDRAASSVFEEFTNPLIDSLRRVK